MKKTPQGNTAIVVFIRSVMEEARVKSFSNSRSIHQSEKVVKELNKHIIRLSKKTGLPVIIGNEKIQEGESFGERFDSVCQNAFSKGFDNLIAIGNDCLKVDANVLTNVADQLEQKPVVIGPTTDGGIYLLGISKDAYQAIEIEKQEWQTASLFISLKNNFKVCQIDIETIELAKDIDDVFELQKAILLLSPFSILRNKISDLLLILIFSFSKKTTFSFQNSPLSFSLRAPPFLISFF